MAAKLETNQPLYKGSKWIYLILCGAVLPLSFYYILLHEITFEWQLLMLLGVYFLVPFWVVFFIGLNIYRYPLKTTPAILLTGSTVIQLLIISALTTGVLAGIYSIFLSSLAGAALFLLTVFGHGLFGATSGHKHWHGSLVLSLLLLSFVSFFLYSIAGPFVTSVFALPQTHAVIGILSMLLTAFLIAHNHHENIMHDDEKWHKQHEKEWHKWIHPVTAVLLLSFLSTLFLVIFI